MNVKQVSIFLEHVPGSLYDVTSTLAENDIHVRALSIAELGGIVILRLVVDNVLWTASILKNSGYPATFTEVVVVNIADVKGGLCRVLEVLKEAGINLEYAYSLIGTNNLGGGVMIFEVNDTSKAVDVLNKEGIKVISQEELYAL